MGWRSTHGSVPFIFILCFRRVGRSGAPPPQPMTGAAEQARCTPAASRLPQPPCPQALVSTLASPASPPPSPPLRDGVPEAGFFFWPLDPGSYRCVLVLRSRHRHQTRTADCKCKQGAGIGKKKWNRARKKIRGKKHHLPYPLGDTPEVQRQRAYICGRT